MKKVEIKKGDIVVFCAVICLAVLSFLCINLFSSSGDIVEIKVDNNVIKQIPIDENVTYDVKIDGVKTNTVEVENSEVRVTYANCPDLICQNHNKISKAGESIICLPNRVIVSIIGSVDDVDGVAE